MLSELKILDPVFAFANYTNAVGRHSITPVQQHWQCSLYSAQQELNITPVQQQLGMNSAPQEQTRIKSEHRSAT